MNSVQAPTPSLESLAEAHWGAQARDALNLYATHPALAVRVLAATRDAHGGCAIGSAALADHAFPAVVVTPALGLQGVALTNSGAGAGEAVHP